MFDAVAGKILTIGGAPSYQVPCRRTTGRNDLILLPPAWGFAARSGCRQSRWHVIVHGCRDRLDQPSALEARHARGACLLLQTAIVQFPMRTRLFADGYLRVSSI